MLIIIRHTTLYLYVHWISMYVPTCNHIIRVIFCFRNYIESDLSVQTVLKVN